MAYVRFVSRRRHACVAPFHISTFSSIWRADLPRALPVLGASVETLSCLELDGSVTERSMGFTPASDGLNPTVSL